MLVLVLISLLSIGVVFGDGSKKGCGSNPADIVFVLDESGSIWNPHFIQQLDFVQSVIEIFDVGYNKTNIGVLAFGTKERVIFQLGQYTDEAQMKAAVKATKQQRGETYTNLALKRMREEMFSRQYARPWVRHVAIVITDGESNYPKETAREGALAHDAGIQVFAIGVGAAVARKELEAIASSDEYVFMVDNYAALDTLRHTLAWQACAPPTPPPTEPPQMIEGCSGQRKMDHIWSISDLAGVEETQYAMKFIESVTSDMTIDPYHVQVGLAPRQCQERRPILLKDHDTKQGFWSGLAERGLSGSLTSGAIEYIRGEGISETSGGRSDAVKYGILIIDYDSANWESTLAEATAAKSEGVKLIVIGVGKNGQGDQMRQLASSSDDFIPVGSYEELSTVKSKVIERFCRGISRDSLRRRLLLERYLADLSAFDE